MLNGYSYTYSCSPSSRKLKHETLHHHISSPSKHLSLKSPSKASTFTGFNQSHNHNFDKSQHFPCNPTVYRRVGCSLSPKQRTPQEKNRVSLGFKLHCHSKTLTLPTRNSSFNGKKKRYGGVLPSILRSLNSDNDIEKTLNSFGDNLNPKEQTVILKEQRNWERMVRVFEFFKSRKDYVPNVIHYNIVLRALGRAQKWDDLRRCWIEMAKSGVLPTNNTYGMLVDVYGKAGLVTEALLWIKHMKLRGLFPDEVTMNTVVKVLKDAGEFDRAHSFYKDWCIGKIELDDLELNSMGDIEHGSGSGPVSFKHFLSTELFKIGGRIRTPKIVGSSDAEKIVRKPRLTSTYNTLIDLYGKAGRLGDAADIFSDMMKSGVAMDTITFNTMIYTCGSHGHLSEAETLLNKMEDRGVSPDTRTYNIFLSLYADEGNIDAAIKCYKKIREVGLLPDTVSHRAILHELCERNMVKEAEAIIEEIEKSSKQVDEHSLPGLVKMYINKGLFDRANDLLNKCQFGGGLSAKTNAAIIDAYAENGLWAEAEAVFYRKRDLVGQKTDILEYNVMIKAYGKGKLYEKAFTLFRSMRHHGTWPDECTYNSLIQMFSGADLMDQARDLLTEMQGVGFKPQCATFSSIIACYARLGQLSDAAGVYQEMVKVGVKPNEVVYGAIINGYAEEGNVKEALKYFHMMEEYGISANQIVLTSLIKVYSKLGCFDSAKQLYQKMMCLEGGPDIIASNSMISLYADLGMISEAELVFNNLREKGSADGVSYATMMYLYKGMGMLDEAIDVAEEMKLSGLLRDSVSYNKVMTCYATNGQLLECGELLHEMIKKKLFPDGGTFKILFTVLKKGGLPTEAVMQLESSYHEGKPYARQAVITSVFSLVGLHALAMESCKIFTKADIALDLFAYNVAIFAYGSSGEIDKALNTFMKMQDEGLEPDLVTSICLVYCYGKAGMVEGVKRIYSQLKYRDIKPSDSAFKAVVDAYEDANRHDLAELVNQELRLGFDSPRFSDSDSDSQQYSHFEGEDGSDMEGKY
ncbi:pentatricopeptide repeat-containing protein At1g73710 [Ricinus communis]|uniref:Pentatricopeptide repeat-containing protein, putative n=1 Tax=Ricinus communis TaxID=3988 RepID=B9RW52_RICCO|nr:pentatricopeptide repeat-containing protein At1g73710 [Ricinus communis]EEF44489.1 pentatricopeptide repeat-containing protein, putative [Ricinus communis]|eukprot:XP_002517971.1 pentatricopeptide repeat-containing protein At1g73710 [Ricinus communis]